MIPLYTEDIENAYTYGEIDLWRSSFRENCSCAKAIDKALQENYADNRLATDKALDTVLAEYGAERVTHVLAAQVFNHDWDGRYHTNVKAWAKEQTKELSAEFMEDSRDYYLNSHPILIDGLVSKVMQREKEIEKTASKPTEKLNLNRVFLNEIKKNPFGFKFEYSREKKADVIFDSDYNEIGTYKPDELPKSSYELSVNTQKYNQLASEVLQCMDFSRKCVQLYNGSVPFPDTKQYEGVKETYRKCAEINGVVLGVKIRGFDKAVEFATWEKDIYGGLMYGHYGMLSPYEALEDFNNRAEIVDKRQIISLEELSEILHTKNISQNLSPNVFSKLSENYEILYRNKACKNIGITPSSDILLLEYKDIETLRESGIPEIEELRFCVSDYKASGGFKEVSLDEISEKHSLVGIYDNHGYYDYETFKLKMLDKAERVIDERNELLDLTESEGLSR